MPDNSIPKAIRWPVFVVTAILIVIAALAGMILASPLKVGLLWAGGYLGFGSAAATSDADTDEGVHYYTCGMHPWVILPKFGDCPICHMALTPINPDKFTGEIAIDPVIVQNMGVRVAPVTTGPLTKRIRTVGTVDYNERTVRDVNIKVAGWIEKLYIDFVGAGVAEGDPLFELYAPELYSTQEQYLLALKGQGQINPGVSADAAQGAVDLVESTRTRLEYFDITDDQIAQLEKDGKPSKTMTIRSPHGGIVIEKHANEGMKVDPGMRVFRIADLSKVWVMVTLYEYQLPYVWAGQHASMELPYIPGQKFQGEVIYIYPYLDEKTREVQVRLEFDNDAGILKPGMFATIQLESTLAAEKTLAPRSAIIDTGERQMAFVSLGDGKFEPREVRLGVETENGEVEIISGLRPGEMIVTSGQFLIDSEAKIREALAKMIKGDLASEQTVSAEVAGTSSLDTLSAEVAGTLIEGLDQYLAIGDLLAADTIEGLPSHARLLATALDTLVTLRIPADEHFWHKHGDDIANARGSAFELAGATDIAAARLQFADLSASLQALLLVTGVPPSFDRQVQALHCPMYREGQGGTYWLQAAGDVRNPYYGPRMLGCFDQRKAMPVTGKASPGSTESDTEPMSMDDQQPGVADESGFGAAPAVAEADDTYPIDFCLVSGAKLGAMGAPVTIEYEGRTLKFCCEDCISSFQKDPETYLKKLDEAARNLGHGQGGE